MQDNGQDNATLPGRSAVLPDTSAETVYMGKPSAAAAVAPSAASATAAAAAASHLGSRAARPSVTLDPASV